MNYLVPGALILLLVPVGILLAGFANLRRPPRRCGAAGPTAMSPPDRPRSFFPLPKPPAIPEVLTRPVRLVRPFALKTQLAVANPFESEHRR